MQLGGARNAECPPKRRIEDRRRPRNTKLPRKNTVLLKNVLSPPPSCLRWRDCELCTSIVIARRLAELPRNSDESSHCITGSIPCSRSILFAPTPSHGRPRYRSPPPASSATSKKLPCRMSS